MLNLKDLCVITGCMATVQPASSEGIMQEVVTLTGVTFTSLSMLAAQLASIVNTVTSPQPGGIVEEW
jgi:hypothetical protein